MDYKSAGVDVEKGDLFVERIKGMIGKTYNSRVVSGVGGFAALYEMDQNRLLATGTDGVGTKVKLAQELGIHDTIGQDLVGMCANDILCTGAKPLFFLDYFATGKLDLTVSEAVVQGIAQACIDTGMALIGGETAEMPDVYPEGVYDLAGFAVGELNRSDWIDGNQCQAGQAIIGIQSSGFHSNGFSLVRKLIQKTDSIDFKKELLTPTRLYVRLIQDMIQDQPGNITGIAHITGGGFENIPRINPNLGYKITQLPPADFRPSSMNAIITRSGLAESELYRTFNMGIGLAITVQDSEQALKFLKENQATAMVLGEVTETEGLSV